jgi:hypothetical protein
MIQWRVINGAQTTTWVEFAHSPRIAASYNYTHAPNPWKADARSESGSKWRPTRVSSAL